MTTETNGTEVAPVMDAMTDIQTLLTRRLGRRPRLEHVAAYFGHKGSGTVSKLLNGQKTEVTAPLRRRIDDTLALLRGDLVTPEGVGFKNPREDFPLMARWHESRALPKPAKASKAAAAPDNLDARLARIESMLETLCEAARQQIPLPLPERRPPGPPVVSTPAELRNQVG
jgi:hypothetical protein